MSVQAITWALDFECGNPVAKLVLITLANYADANCEAWPSQALLAKQCGVSPRCIRENLVRLEMVGAILREERRRKDGSQMSDLYHLNVGEQQAEESATCQAEDYSAPPEPGSAPPAESAALVRDKLLLEPTNEPCGSGVPPPVDALLAEIWKLWPSLSRKRHTQAAVRKALLAQLKTGATPEQILAAGRAHVRERSARGDEFVKGLVPWLANGLWRNWLPDEIGPADEWAKRYEIFDRDGTWLARWGPDPKDPSHAGPRRPLFQAAGGKP